MFGTFLNEFLQVWRVHAIGGITVTEADAGEIIVPPRRQNRPMRPAYSQSTTNRDDEWVIGGKLITELFIRK